MTQCKQIKKHLQKHGSITPIDALKLYGCFRLGARIYELRRQMSIETEMIRENNKRFAKYVLKK
jgi:hypothetical protein